jgi:hypothetical protein
MGFLKKLLGGGGSSRGKDGGIYVYVRLARTGEVVRLRLTIGYEISRDDEGVLFTRKLIMGSSSFEKAEATIYFDDSYRVTGADITGGEIADESDWLAQEAERSTDEG